MSKLSPEAKALIDAARPHERPALGERARVRRALVANLATGAALGATTKPTAAAAGGLATKGTIATATTAASFGAATKVVATLAIVGAVGGGALGALRSTRSLPSLARVAPSASAPTVPAPAEERPVRAATLAEPAGAPEPPDADSEPIVEPGGASASSVASAPHSAARSRVASSPPRADAPPSARAELAGAREPTDATALANALDKRDAGAASTPPRPARSASAPAEAPRLAGAAPLAPGPSTFDEEVRRLRQVQHALREGDAGRALRLLGAGDATPGGPLLDEQRAARFLALCRLGRVDEAKAEAARLVAASPNSPVAPRVRKGCVPSSTR
jgi:hypothetical protein